MSAGGSPERALVAAVLAQAVRDLGVKQYRESVRRWVQSDNARPFGFVWCVEALGLNVEWARAKIADRKFDAGLLTKAA